jgi:protein-L-isoaspartate O-methyltransferase
MEKLFQIWTSGQDDDRGACVGRRTACSPAVVSVDPGSFFVRFVSFVAEYLCDLDRVYHSDIMQSSQTGRRLLVVATLALGVAAVAAQQRGVHPVSGRVYALPMGVQGASWLDRRERDAEEDPDLAVRLLRLPRGATVADIGAGSGYMTVRLAKAVGPTGKVYANDLQPGMLQLLEKTIARERLTNVVPVLGTVDDPRLPDATIDLAIMVDVYHEFSEPQRMLQRIRTALKPGGRLVLLEYRAEDPDVPILPDHKMTKAQVKLEVEHEGFKQQRVYDDLPRQHLIVFTRP